MYNHLRNTVKLALVAKLTQKNIIQKDGIFLTLTVMIKNVYALSSEQKLGTPKRNGICYIQEKI